MRVDRAVSLRPSNHVLHATRARIHITHEHRCEKYGLARLVPPILFMGEYDADRK
jgi:hypothetical protein